MPVDSLTVDGAVYPLWPGNVISPSSPIRGVRLTGKLFVTNKKAIRPDPTGPDDSLDFLRSNFGSFEVATGLCNGFFLRSSTCQIREPRSADPAVSLLIPDSGSRKKSIPKRSLLVLDNCSKFSKFDF